MKYDIFITAHDKDDFKLKYLILSIYKNMRGWETIYIVTPSGKEILKDVNIVYLKDEEVSNIDKTRFKHRPNWQWQMHAKLLQDVTKNDWYFTIDADCYINRPLQVWGDEGNFILYRPSENVEQNHVPYFEYQTKLFNLPRKYPHTFITDTNFMCKSLVRKMLFDAGFPTVQEFIEKSIETITPNCYMGEPELWGQWVAENQRNNCEIKIIKTAYDAKTQNAPTDKAWTETEYFEKLKEMSKQDLDIFAIHSWWDWHV